METCCQSGAGSVPAATDGWRSIEVASGSDCRSPAASPVRSGRPDPVEPELNSADTQRGAAALTIRFGLTDLPMGASWPQVIGVLLLCGIGFTMSLFIGLLAFADNPALQDEVKIGIL